MSHLQVPASDPLGALDGQLLSDDEARYVSAARAANTLRGYRSDWGEWCSWCAHHGHEPLPADPVAVSRYLIFLAGHGAKVETMSRRLSALRFAHQLRNLPSPTDTARVMTVWEGIRRTHGAPADQAAPLQPPELFHVLDACPTTKLWRTRGRAPEPSLAGARDRVLLVVGFVGAFRRSELAALDVDDVAPHTHGLVVTIPRSKGNQTGEQVELVVIPRAGNPQRCPVRAFEQWLELADITAGPVFRKVTKANRVSQGRLHAESINQLVQAAVARAGLDPGPYSAHSLRAGFRHLRPPPRRLRPGHRPPDPPPLRRHPGPVHPYPRGLGGQRRHPARVLRPSSEWAQRDGTTSSLVGASGPGASRAGGSR